MKRFFLLKLLLLLLLIFIFLFSIFYMKMRCCDNKIKEKYIVIEKNSKNPEYFTNLFWKDIIFESDEQLKVNKTILFKTLKHMLKETDEEDPELIEFVRSLIQPPATDPLNLEDKSNLRIDFSQRNQSLIIDDVLNKKRNGFLIEAGAYDGEFQSNSLFFEMQRNWTGLLIEPVPSFFEKILTKNRKMFKINACIANGKPSVQKFRYKEFIK